jgi:hypothetical protein
MDPEIVSAALDLIKHFDNDRTRLDFELTKLATEYNITIADIMKEIINQRREL